MSAPMRTEGIDNASSILLPYYDQDTKIMYLAGKVSPKLHSVNLLVICFKTLVSFAKGGMHCNSKILFIIMDCSIIIL